MNGAGEDLHAGDKMASEMFVDPQTIPRGNLNRRLPNPNPIYLIYMEFAWTDGVLATMINTRPSESGKRASRAPITIVR